MQDRTEIIVLLDRSGSMIDLKKDMEAGFSEFLKAHQQTPSTKLTLIQFDSVDPQEVLYTAKPVNDVPALTLLPRGGTPLLDAWKRAVDLTGQRLAAMPESERPRGVLFVVITDGEENSSHVYSRADVFAAVTHQEQKYGWQFLYLGANQDAIGEAISLGVTTTKAFDYKASHLGTSQMYRTVGANTASFTASVAGGASLPQSANFLNFSTQQRVDAADDDEALKQKAADLNNVTFSNTTT